MKTIKELKPGDKVWVVKVERYYWSTELIETVVEEHNPEFSEMRLARVVDGRPTTSFEIFDYWRCKKPEESTKFSDELRDGTYYYTDKQEAKEEYLKILDKQEEIAKHWLNEIRSERNRIINL